jgi:NADPH:quinone reductase-like Zn-dependent oxidoreductase
VQSAKAVGCEVTGVVGASHKVETVRELGADHVIDKSREPLWREAEARAPDGYDVVLDANGVATLEDSYAHVAAGGRLVVYGFHSMLPRGRGRPSWPKLAWDFLRTPRFEPLEMTNSNRSVLAFNLSYLFDRVDVLQGALTELFGWVDAGKLRPPKVQHFALSDVAEAHRALESGQTVGKLVLTVEPD